MKKRISHIDFNKISDEIHTTKLHHVIGVNASDYSFDYHKVAVKEKVEYDSFLLFQKWPDPEMCYDGWTEFYSHFDYKTCVSSSNNITFIDADGIEHPLRIGDWSIIECKFLEYHSRGCYCYYKFLYEIKDRYGKKQSFELLKKINFGVHIGVDQYCLEELSNLCSKICHFSDFTSYNNNADFWASVRSIIAEGFTPEGLLKLDNYAEDFISRRLVYQRFSPHEQHGCAAGGATNVIASLLAGAEAGAGSPYSSALSDFERERQCGAKQEAAIEQWARAVGVWTEQVDDELPRVLGEQIAEGGEAKVYDHGATLIKSIGLDYFIQPIFALDRIALHNTYFPETRLTVLGFGRDSRGEFKIIAEQPYIDGQPVSDAEIADYMRLMGFELKNARNWTYATPDIYLSDMHDENVIRSNNTHTIFVVDCDIRINTPVLRQGGTRTLTNAVEFV